jgi:hypothetical protein
VTVLNKPILPAAAWLIACLAMPAMAEPACDDVYSKPIDPAQRLQQALDLEALCYRHAAYLYQLGTLLNKMGRYDEALDRLEGAMLHQPDHWPSQLEYAIALEGIGDVESAAGLLANLAQNTALDSSTQQQIAALRQQSGLAPRPLQRTALGLSTGYDDNLMGSTQQQQFDLTLPSGRLPVATDASQRPRAGRFERFDIRYDGDFGTGLAAHWRYTLLGSYRQSPDYTPANQGQLGVMIERNTSGQQGFYWRAVYQELTRGGINELRQTRLEGGYERATLLWGQVCQQRLGLDLQQLAYPASENLDGHYTGLALQAYCPTSGLQVQLRAGQDQPTQSSRLGGSQRQYGLRVGKSTPLGAANLAVELEYNHQSDQTGYSELLENNLPRQISRLAYRIEYSWVAGKLSPYVGFEWVSQQANLPLFGLENRLLTAGVRVKW